MIIASKQSFLTKDDGIRLPSKYKKLPFLNTNGKKWSYNTQPKENSAGILTTVKPTHTLLSEINVTLLENNNDFEWGDFLGLETTHRTANYDYSIRCSNIGNPKIHLVAQTKQTFSEKRIFMSFNTPYIIKYLPSSFYSLLNLNDKNEKEIKISLSNSSFCSDYCLGLCGGYWVLNDYTKTLYCGMPALFGECKFTETATNTVIAHYIPAKRKSDAVCGFYDVINNTFYHSITPIAFSDTE